MVGTLNGLLDVNILFESYISLLGYLDIYISPIINTIRRALFVARRQIAVKWIFPTPLLNLAGSLISIG